MDYQTISILTFGILKTILVIRARARAIRARAKAIRARAIRRFMLKGLPNMMLN